MLVMRPSQNILRILILTRRMMYNKKKFMEDLLFFVTKSYMPIIVVGESMANASSHALKSPLVVFFNQEKWFNVPSFHWW